MTAKMWKRSVAMKPKALLILIWTLWFALSPVWVWALPNGGNIIAGNGAIQSSGGQMTIQQNTQQMITNWQGFSIGAAEAVTFQQPNAQSVSLNRVVGTDPSRIMGLLTSNGRVFLTNPSGVLFGAGAQVNVHGLIATTLAISDQDFLDGNYRFYQDPTRSLASVVNKGRITASGFVGLFAPAVENQGMIVANLGSVVMASGEATALDFTGDNLIRFAITQAVTGEVKDTEGNVLVDRVRNTGTVSADGGLVTLSAWDAGQVIQNVVNNEGIIQARSVEKKNGQVILHGGPSGTVMNTGMIDVTGDDAGETGGVAVLLGEHVGLDKTAMIDASGTAGGGAILVGGFVQVDGQEIPNAQATFIGENATVKADATESGDGGTVVVYAEGSTRIYGKLSARGGPNGGNGGLLQTSGIQYFELGQLPDLTAPNGQGGSWLIGPVNLDLVAGGGATPESSEPNFQPAEEQSTLGVDLITGALTGGVAVTVFSFNELAIENSNLGNDIDPDFQSGGLNLKADIDFNGSQNGSLALFGSNDVNIDANIFDSTPGDGDLLNLTLTADSDTNGRGDVNIGRGVSVNVGNGDFGIVGNDVDIEGQLFSTFRIYITPRDNGTIGVDGAVGSGDVSNICGGPCGLTLSGTELQNIHAPGNHSLVIGNGFNDDVYVSGVTTDHTANHAITDFRSASDLHFVNAPSEFSSRIRALPFGEIIVDTDVSGVDINFSSIGNVFVNANVTASNNFFSFLPLGDFHLAAGKTLMASNDVFLAANDIHIQGSVVAGQTVHINNSVNSANIGLGNATGDLTIDNDELSNITANALAVGDTVLDTPEVIVDGMEAEHILHVGIQSAAPGSFKGQITFMGSSKFNNLILNAGDKILVDGTITTLGDFLARVEQDFLIGGQTFTFTLDGIGTFEVTPGSSITTGKSITIIAEEFIIDGTLAGTPVVCIESTTCVVPVEGTIPPVVAAPPSVVTQTEDSPLDNPFLQKGTQSTFINFFIEDSKTNC